MNNEQYTIASVSRAFQIIKLFDQNHRAMTLTELSVMSGIAKSSVLRVLATMEQADFVKYDPDTKKYRLGIIMYKLASSAFDFLDIKEIAKGILKEAADESELMLHLAIANEGEVYVIDKIFPRNESSIELISRIGNNVPLHCTGVGKVLAAFSDEQERKKLIERCTFERYTENTITNVEEFRKVLKNVQSCGYAINNCEHESYVKCVTYPVFDYKGNIAAAVSMTGLEQVMSEQMVEACKRRLKVVTKRISKELGYAS